MDEIFELALWGGNTLSAVEELKACNLLTVKYGLFLTEKQIQTLIAKRFDALKSTGRVEFGSGMTKMLIEAFSDSSYIDQSNYEETMLALIDLFYYYKNESNDRIPDDELISFMRIQFDTACQGSIEYLSGTSLEDLCRNSRYGYKADDNTDDLQSDEEVTLP